MRITLGTTDTFYQKIGSGPMVVLLHGWGCDWQIWSPLIPELSKKYQLIIPDLPGFGNSKTTDIDQWTTSDYVSWLETFVKEVISKDTFVLIGHSLGGKIASVFAAQSSLKKQIATLVLIDSSGIPLELSAVKNAQQRVLGIIPQSLKDAIPYSLKEKLLRATHSSTDHFFSNPQQKELLKRLVREDIRPHLSTITTATTIIWGENDEDTPLIHGKEFHRLIDGSEFRVFPTGHFPFIEQPQEVLSTLTKIL